MIRYLPELEMTHKKKILFDQRFVTDKKGGNEKLYSPEMNSGRLSILQYPNLCILGFNRTFNYQVFVHKQELHRKLEKLLKLNFLYLKIHHLANSDVLYYGMKFISNQL